MPIFQDAVWAAVLIVVSILLLAKTCYGCGRKAMLTPAVFSKTTAVKGRSLNNQCAQIGPRMKAFTALHCMPHQSPMVYPVAVIDAFVPAESVQLYQFHTL